MVVPFPGFAHLQFLFTFSSLVPRPHPPSLVNQVKPLGLAHILTTVQCLKHLALNPALMTVQPSNVQPLNPLKATEKNLLTHNICMCVEVNVVPAWSHKHNMLLLKQNDIILKPSKNLIPSIVVV